MKKNLHGKMTRLLALTAALVMAVILLPSFAFDSSALAASKKWGRLTGDKVYFRKQASTSAENWGTLPQGWVLEYLGTVKDNQGKTWYKVQGNHPDHLNRTYVGYIYSSYFTLLTDAEADAWESNPLQVGHTATPVPNPDSRFAVSVVDGARVREYIPDGPVRVTVPLDAVVQILSSPASLTDNDWYFVSYKGLTGYVNAPLLRALTDEEAAARHVTGAPSVTPTPAPYTPSGNEDYDGNCRLKADSVRFRAAPNGAVLAVLPVGTLFPYWGTGTRGTDGYLWFNVMYNGAMGYIRADMLTFLDNAGKPTAQPTASVITTPTPVPTAVPSSTQYMRLTAGGVNYRTDPDGTILGRVDKGTVLPFFGYDMSGKWALVYSDTYGFGYISTQFCYLCDVNGNKCTATPKPLTPTATPTAVPPVTVYGYVVTSLSGVNLRTGNDTSSSVIRQLAKNTVTELVGSPVSDAKGTAYTWFPVRTQDGTLGYVRGDCAYRMADWQEAYYLSTGKIATPSPAPVTTPTSDCPWVMVTGNNVNVRSSSSTTSRSLGTVNKGSVFKLLSSTRVGSYVWYRVQYKTSTAGYIRSDLIHRMSWDEYYAWQGSSSTATPVPGKVTPTPTAYIPVVTPSATSNVSSDLSDMAFCTGNSVNIREDAGTGFRSVGTVYTKDSRMVYLFESKTGTDGNTWYKVQYGTVIGWMSGKYCNVLTNRQKTAYLQTGNPDAKPEASYTTLSLGSTGNAVTVLQKELAKLGYLAESQINGQYLSTTVTAVKAFQQQHGLSVDGVAGADTQHALFNTVPEGTNTQGTVVPDLQPVEKVDWVKGDIQTLWGRGETAIITDVKTGLSFRARRWAGGEHADVEPLTAADTAVFCRIYNVSRAQDIKELNIYERRAVWVTLKGRTICASIYGVPHNEEDGDTIPDNDFVGQFCVHFTNSRTHGGTSGVRKVDPDHQAAIQYAYDHSVSGWK